MANVEDTLAQRNNVHGDYAKSASIKDEVLARLECTPNWEKMDSVGRQTIRMIVEKLGRVMFGDWSFVDHWHDIAGYSTLMQHHCEDINHAKSPSKD